MIGMVDHDSFGFWSMLHAIEDCLLNVNLKVYVIFSIYLVTATILLQKSLI